MHPVLHPLDEQQSMLLLSALLLEGEGALEYFRFLPPDEQGLMNEKAQALLQIESEKRGPLIAKLVREGLGRTGKEGFERVDPSWVVERLRGEAPAVVAAILVTLPDGLVRSVVKRLPDAVRKAMPSKAAMRQVDPALLKHLRQIFDQGFEEAPTLSTAELSFASLLLLERKELGTLLRTLGLVELGQAFGSVGRLALAELCRRLPREASEELIEAVKQASRVDAPDIQQAQRFLARVVVNFDTVDEFFQKAGLWRVAKALLLEPESFRQSFRQRISKGAADLLEDYVSKAEQMGLDEGAQRRLQDAIVVDIKQASERGKIGPQWAALRAVLHDPDYLMKLEAAEARMKSARSMAPGLGGT